MLASSLHKLLAILQGKHKAEKIGGLNVLSLHNRYMLHPMALRAGSLLHTAANVECTTTGGAGQV